MSDEPLAAPESVTAPTLPPRPVWAVVTPSVPWCPDEWREHLEAIAPGISIGHGAPEHEEAVGAHGRRSGWELLVASRRGRLHAHRGEHREDAGTVLLCEHGWCAAVADGAGSAPYSRLGAAIAVHAVTHALRELLQAPAPHVGGVSPASTLRAALLTAAGGVQRAMEAFAEQTGCAPRALRTTLLVAALHHDAIGLLQVGDGGIVWLHDDGRTSQPMQGDSGEFSGEVAHFLPDAGALARLQQSVLVQPAAGCAAVLLASDGVEDPWYPLPRHAASLYQQLQQGVSSEHATAAGVSPAHTTTVLNAPDPVRALVEWLSFEKRGENDDRTLCVARRVGSVWAPLAAA